MSHPSEVEEEPIRHHHSAERTNPKGVPSINRCRVCGRANMTLTQVLTTECIPHNEDDALVEAINEGH